MSFESEIQDAADNIREILGSTLFPHLICDETSLESDYTFKIVRREFDRLSSIVGHAHKQKQKGDLLYAVQQTKQQKIEGMHLWRNAQLVPPVYSHSNNHMNIKDVSVIPPMDELTATQQPSLPGNFQSIKEAHWLPPGPERLIDTHFRLLREDLVGPLKANIKGFCSYLQSRKSKGKLQMNASGRLVGNSEKADMSLELSQVDVNVYFGVKLSGFLLHPRAGVSAIFRFDKPKCCPTHRKEEKNFWKSSDRLACGMLVGLVFQLKENVNLESLTIIFGTVAERDEGKLAEKPNSCELLVKIPSQFMTHEIISRITKSSTGYLIETNQIMFEGYRPILEGLKKMDPHSMPFARILAPSMEQISDKTVEIPPPLYAQTPHFKFNLSYLDPSSCNNLTLDPCYSGSWSQTVSDLESLSALDEGQARALVHALSSEFACIQGPPGTGKSFVGVEIVRALLMNKQNATPENPILLICFTNHALDQFIFDLLDRGVDKIVRLGNSKNYQIQQLLLKNVAPKKLIGYSVSGTYAMLDDCKTRLDELNKELFKESKLIWLTLKDYLLVHHYKHYTSLYKMIDFESDATGFKKVGRGGQDITEDNLIEYWLTISPPQRKNRNRSIQELLEEDDVWMMTKNERNTLFSYWEDALPTGNFFKLSLLQAEVENILSTLEGAYLWKDADFLKDQNIIAATTTAAAKFHSMIQSAGAKIIVCEEAGEVLEAHILAALHPDIQQLILIGDHEQLRPRIAVHDLSCESKKGSRYRLDMSLFERLQRQEQKIPLQTLTIQRRMRPEIADFIRSFLYKELRDSENVLQYPQVQGIRKNVYFIDHSIPQDAETSQAKSMSHSNRFEAEYCVALVRYIIRQGYAPEDIVLLTPYVRQLMQLRDLLGNEMVVLISEHDMSLVSADGEYKSDENSENMQTHGKQKIAQKLGLKNAIRVSTIDNFQGEEAKIAIISLVRSGISKRNQSIGFLKSTNRINVLLSRAKHGMYLIDPIVVLTCGHVFTIETMDGVVGLHNVYDRHDDWALRQLPNEFIDRPRCPNCRKPVSQIFRYGRILNLAASQAAEKIWITSINEERTHLFAMLETLYAEGLANASQAKNFTNAPDEVQKLRKLREKSRRFATKCAESPQWRLHRSNLTFLMRNGRTGDEAVEELKHGLPTPHKFFCRSSVELLAKCGLAICQVLVNIADSQPISEGNITCNMIGRALKELDASVEETEHGLNEYRSTSQTRENSELELQLLLYELRAEKIHVEWKSHRQRTTANNFERERKLESVKIEEELEKFKQDLPLSFVTNGQTRIAALTKKIENLKTKMIFREEMKLVVHAMSQEFTYTIGECGGPVQIAACPECNAPIGGSQHQLTSGNSSRPVFVKSFVGGTILRRVVIEESFKQQYAVEGLRHDPIAVKAINWKTYRQPGMNFIVRHERAISAKSIDYGAVDAEIEARGFMEHGKPAEDCLATMITGDLSNYDTATDSITIKSGWCPWALASIKKALKHETNGQQRSDYSSGRDIWCTETHSGGSSVKWATTQFLKEGDLAVLVNVQKSADVVMSDFLAHGGASALGDIYVPDAAEKIEKLNEGTARDVLGGFAAVVRDTCPGVNVQGVMAIGSAKEVVVDFVSELKADALVVGSRGINALSRSLIGSVSDYCLHHCQCPVLVAKPTAEELKALIPEVVSPAVLSDTDMFVALPAA
ncbi:hypothetical protein HDU82_002890 [Entophlyctis luteolus]|nr:hypothetical protein HDU82_002890 [Entophlyctis luteolus]